jgi:hypothetical protein
MGSDGPDGWILGTSSEDGDWIWDTATAAEGLRSAKIAVIGSEDHRSPALRSSNFSLLPGREYTFSAWSRTVRVAGKYGAFVWLVELDANGEILMTDSGSVVQHAIRSDQGTNAWSRSEVTFTTDPRCAGAYVYGIVYDARGVFWVDDVRVE